MPAGGARARLLARRERALAGRLDAGAVDVLVRLGGFEREQLAQALADGRRGVERGQGLDDLAQVRLEQMAEEILRRL